MDSMIPFGIALQTLEQTLGLAGAVTVLTKSLFEEKIPSIAASMNADGYMIMGQGRIPDNGTDWVIPREFWVHNWEPEQEWTWRPSIPQNNNSRYPPTPSNHSVHYKVEWMKGDFSRTETAFRKQNIIVLRGVRIGQQGFTNLCTNLGINAQTVGEIGQLSEWIKSSTITNVRDAWREYKDTLGANAQNRATFEAEWKRLRGDRPRGRPRQS